MENNYSLATSTHHVNHLVAPKQSLNEHLVINP